MTAYPAPQRNRAIKHARRCVRRATLLEHLSHTIGSTTPCRDSAIPFNDIHAAQPGDCLKKPAGPARHGNRGRATKIMEAKTNLKSRLPSRHATEGPDRAPHRAFYYAMGLTTEQIHQPFVGVATCWNEAAPCNISLMRQAQAVKRGVASVGGTPREFCTITVTDGIAMGHEGMKSSLPSREVIADSVELTVRGHSYDALIGVAGCDKSQPGMMMAMCRLNVPSIYIYGGSILPGTFKGKPVTIQDVYEAVGKHSVGGMSSAVL